MTQFKRVITEVEVKDDRHNRASIISSWSQLHDHIRWRLHGEVGDVGVSRDLELEDALGGGGVPVEHGAVHRREGVAGDDGGLDGELLDVRFSLLQRKHWTTQNMNTQIWSNITTVHVWHGFTRPRGASCKSPKYFFFHPYFEFPPKWQHKKTEAGAFVPMSSDQLSALQIFLAHLRAWRTSCASRPERTS